MASTRRVMGDFICPASPLAGQHAAPGVVAWLRAPAWAQLHLPAVGQ